MNKRLQQIFEFICEIEKLKLVERIPYLSDKKRRENDAEHSWHLAMMFLALEKEFENKFDTLHTLKLILVHDLIEIHTGDDWVTTKEAKELKLQQETEAADKLFSLLPKDLNLEFRALWEEYAEGKSKEAKIAKGLDKLSYSIQHYISKKINWHNEGSSIQATVDYAMPHVKTEQTLVEIFDFLMQDRAENHKLFEWSPRENPKTI